MERERAPTKRWDLMGSKECEGGWLVGNVLHSLRIGLFGSTPNRVRSWRIAQRVRTELPWTLSVVR